MRLEVNRVEGLRNDLLLQLDRVEIDEHLRRLSILAGDGSVRRRAVAVSNRNLGTNHGHVAWQRAETPRIFRIREDYRASRRQRVVYGRMTRCAWGSVN